MTRTAVANSSRFEWSSAADAPDAGSVSPGSTKVCCIAGTRGSTGDGERPAFAKLRAAESVREPRLARPCTAPGFKRGDAARESVVLRDAAPLRGLAACRSASCGGEPSEKPKLTSLALQTSAPTAADDLLAVEDHEGHVGPVRTGLAHGVVRVGAVHEHEAARLQGPDQGLVRPDRPLPRLEKEFRGGNSPYELLIASVEIKEPELYGTSPQHAPTLQWLVQNY